jgi:lipopolysaccharide/colanic/teichoic acid biosynthesis glycosyltransferase
MSADTATPQHPSSKETTVTPTVTAPTTESRTLRRSRPLLSDAVRTKISPSRYVACKEICEWVVALFLFLCALPIIVLFAILVRLTSRGPSFYSQTRLGKNGVPFRIFKIRTMYHDCEKRNGPQWSRPGDPRITPVGRLLRRMHLDELPQLWNVLRGDMALVGPRPERPEFVPVLEQAIPCYADRLLVKPGVTGLAQVQLPPDTDIFSVRRKLAYDLHYITRINFWLDVRLIVCTAVHMLGVPYRHLTWLFRMPSLDVVEQAYNNGLSK